MMLKVVLMYPRITYQKSRTKLTFYRDISLMSISYSHLFLLRMSFCQLKKAVDISRIIDYYLWAYDKKLTDSDKLKGRENYKILILLLSGITEGMYTLTEIGEKVYLKSNLSYGYTEKYNCGRLYPNKSSILHISNEFRYHLLKDLYDYVGIINAHPTILYNYAISHDISPLFVRTVSE